MKGWGIQVIVRVEGRLANLSDSMEGVVERPLPEAALNAPLCQSTRGSLSTSFKGGKGKKRLRKFLHSSVLGKCELRNRSCWTLAPCSQCPLTMTKLYSAIPSSPGDSLSAINSDLQKDLFPFDFIPVFWRILPTEQHSEFNLLSNCKTNLINSIKVCNLRDSTECASDFFFF